MFPLVHNIDFVIAAICVLLVIYCSVGRRYSKISESNRMFYRIVNTAMVQSFVDIFMNVSETYTDIFGTFWPSISRTVFNTLTVILTYFTYAYVKAYSKDQEKFNGQVVLDILVWILLGFFSLAAIVNLFTGIISYVDENGVYHNGPIYNINYVVPVILLIIILVTAIKRRRYFTKQQFGAIFFFIVLVVMGVFLEFLLNYTTLTTMFGVSLALLIVQLSLETPDYKKMTGTMEELKRSNEEVEKARDAAEAANRAKSDFLARMSHEIRTPMNAVLGMNELIIKECDDSTIKEYAKDAYTSANSLLNIINDILDFSKIESGKLAIILDKYDMAGMLREEYTILSFKAEDKGLGLIFEIDPSIPSKLFGDSVRIKQVVTNLLNNAIKYTDKGMVTMKASLESKQGKLAMIRFEIIDTGRGIKEEDLGKLFDKFERIDEKNNRNIEGTGLGLNIAAMLLQNMNSELKVESEYGKGSRFFFTIPQEIINDEVIGKFEIVDSSKEAVKEEKQELIYCPNLKILVVDDNMVNLKVFEGLLRKTGAQITKATSGQKALEYTKTDKYDIIFMDHMMPGMDGVETFHAVRSQECGVNSDTPVVVLTANAIKGSYEEYLGYGFDDVCYKPTTQKDLNEKLIRWAVSK